MLKMANAEPRLMNGLQEAVLLLCKAGLKFESTLSVDGLLAITVDQKDVFLVNIKQTIGDSEDHTLEADNGDRNPIENAEISAGNSADDFGRKQSSNHFAAVSNNCVQRVEQKNVENSQGNAFSESRCVADLDTSNGEAMLAKEINRRPGSFRRLAMNRIKRPLNLPSQRQCKGLQINFFPGNLRNTSNLEYFAEEVERTQRDEAVLPPETRFDIRARGINSGLSNLESDVATTEVDHQLLCKIKQEPRDESHLAYQVSHPLEALSQSEIDQPKDFSQFQAELNLVSHPLEALSQSEIDQPKDFSQFSPHSYSVHRLLQSQAAAWSHVEAQPRTSSSLHHNMSSANWPRRQIRSSDKSICVNCGTNTTTVWRRGKEGQLLCNACGCYYKLHKMHRPQSLMKDNIRRRSRRHQGLRWTMDAVPATSPHNVLPFPLGWNHQDVEQS